MSLTDTAVRNSKKSEKPQKLSDGGGLFFARHPGGFCHEKWICAAMKRGENDADGIIDLAALFASPR